jgi:hypothetical protein
MGVRDTARFYPIDGQQYPSVTTVLGIIDKSGPLMGWAVKEERRAFEATLLEVLSHDGARDPLYVRGKMADAVKGVKAAEKVRQDAILIDTAAHALIEWHTRRLLGEKVGPEPMVPDPAAWAVEAWKDWARAVDFTPLSAERTVHCPQCGYAGTFDWVARVAGVVTLGDYKTGRAIYPESFLQNVAYRHAAIHAGFPTAQGVILPLAEARGGSGLRGHGGAGHDDDGRFPGGAQALALVAADGGQTDRRRRVRAVCGHGPRAGRVMRCPPASLCGTWAWRLPRGCGCTTPASAAGPRRMSCVSVGTKERPIAPTEGSEGGQPDIP